MQGRRVYPRSLFVSAFACPVLNDPLQLTSSHNHFIFED